MDRCVAGAVRTRNDWATRERAREGRGCVPEANEETRRVGSDHRREPKASGGRRRRWGPRRKSKKEARMNTRGTRRLRDGREVDIGRNDGLRKVCRCGRHKWTKCPHPWHFSF